MKTVVVTKYGGPEVLRVVDTPMPEVGPGQVLIAVKSAGINFADLMSRAGTYPLAPKPPFTPGFEVAGIVEKVGEGVSFPAVGAKVAAMLFKSGGYAEYVTIDAASAVPIPGGLDFAQATALLVQGLTAYFLLQESAKMEAGQSVLVSGAAGGVGSLAVQIAKKLGAGNVVGLVSTDAKAALVKALGATSAVNYTEARWSEQVKAAMGGKGADIFLDATAGTDGEGYATLASGGQWIIYGSQSGSDNLGSINIGQLIFDNKTIRGFSIYSVAPEKIGAALQQLMTWAVSGELRLITGDAFPLADVAAAHTAIAERRTTGKVTLTV